MLHHLDIAISSYIYSPKHDIVDFANEIHSIIIGAMNDIVGFNPKKYVPFVDTIMRSCLPWEDCMIILQKLHTIGIYGLDIHQHYARIDWLMLTHDAGAIDFILGLGCRLHWSQFLVLMTDNCHLPMLMKYAHLIDLERGNRARKLLNIGIICRSWKMVDWVIAHGRIGTARGLKHWVSWHNRSQSLMLALARIGQDKYLEYAPKLVDIGAEYDEEYKEIIDHALNHGQDRVFVLTANGTYDPARILNRRIGSIIELKNPAMLSGLRFGPWGRQRWLLTMIRRGWAEGVFAAFEQTNLLEALRGDNGEVQEILRVARSRQHGPRRTIYRYIQKMFHGPDEPEASRPLDTSI